MAATDTLADLITKAKAVVVAGGTEIAATDALTTKVFGSYAGLDTAAQAMVAKSSGTLSGTAKAAFDTIKSLTKTFDKTKDKLGDKLGADSKQFKKIVKENASVLKEHAGTVTDQIYDALGAHKDAYAELESRYAELSSKLQETLTDGIEKAGGSATAIEAATKEYSVAERALTTLYEQQKRGHERAVEAMESTVEALVENGVKLKKDFNFDLTSKGVVNKVEKAAEAGAKASESIGTKLEEGAAKGGGWGRYAEGAAGVGFLLHGLNDEESKMNWRTVVGAVLTGDAARRMFFSDAGKNLGNVAEHVRL